jgi:hypothetical protein
MPRQTNSNGDNMPTISSLTDEINRLSESISRWNTAIIVLMVLAALAATGLVIAQRIAFKKADRLADLTEQRAKLDSAAKDHKIGEANDRRVELQNKILDTFGSRRLTATQSASIARRLTGLKGVKIDVYVVDPGNWFTSSEDSVSLGRDFVSTLRAANMDAKGWVMGSCANGVQVSSVSVISIDPDGPDRRIASRVLDAFRPEVGMYSEIGDTSPACTKLTDLDKDDPNKRPPDANIRIAIGRKIQPILTRKMLEPVDEQGKP